MRLGGAYQSWISWQIFIVWLFETFMICHTFSWARARGPMGPIFFVWIGQTLWVLECPERDWDAAIFLVQ